MLVCNPLERIAPHGFTTRRVDFRPSADGQAAWSALAGWLAADGGVQRVRQVHGAQVATSVPGGPAVAGEADALVSSDPSVAVAVQVADCVPILIADSRGAVVAAVHAGWRGTVASVAQAAVRRLVDEHGVRSADLIAAIGPSIGPCCYQVGPEVRAAFVAAGHGNAEAWFTPDVGDREKLDVPRANVDQLIAAGLRPSSVHVSGLCTSCRLDRFFSYRREGAAAGRLVAAIRAAGRRGANG